MAAYRPLGQFPQYLLADGSVNAGGSISFYETDLTTPKTTYSDSALSVPNPQPVPLDASGIPQNDVWGSGIYGAVMVDAFGANPRTFNNIQSGADPGFVIPALVNGDFLTNDASNLLWQAILQVPDPTGFGTGDTINTDGSTVFWAPSATVSGDQNSLILGTVKLQTGTGNSPATNTNTSNVAVVFPEAFTGTPRVMAVCNLVSALTNMGGIAVISVTAVSSTGFNFTAGDNDYTGATGGIIVPVPFTWWAIGPA